MKRVALAAFVLAIGLSIGAAVRDGTKHATGRDALAITRGRSASEGLANALHLPPSAPESFSGASPSHGTVSSESTPLPHFGGPICPRGDRPVCPQGTLSSQGADGPANFTAGVSEFSSGFDRMESFGGAVGRIEGITWWGLDLQPVGINDFVECVEATPEFQIQFFEDEGGQPGNLVRAHTLIATRTDTGLDYQGAQLNEYHVDLPDPLVLPRGWLAIIGFGDPNCWFLWLSSRDGDGRSLCEFCDDPTQPFDLSYCLNGTPGGVFGACCDEASGVCTDNVPIAACAGPGQRFYADTPCGAIPEACELIRGACCIADGSCSEIPYSECLSQGGEWLGAFTSCGQCPPRGACCLDSESCIITTQDVCEDEGQTWLGQGTACGECPATPTCDAAALFSQSPDGPRDFLAGTSEMATGLRRFENFSGVGGAIDRIVWWGVDLVRIGPAWVECVEFDPTFEISFHEDAGGIPGDALCTYTLTATRTPRVLMYNGTELNEYEVFLPTPCVLTRGWVSIVGLGDPDCWFLWMSAGRGFSWCEGCQPSQQDQDYSMCLHGTAGGIFGACCNDATGQCRDEVEISDCVAPQERFLPDGGCGDFDPPCGIVMGACCFSDQPCQQLQQADCQAAGGQWLGANSICSQCPCSTPCPASGVPEGEPVCSDGYIDTFNAGCLGKPAVFSPIVLSRPVCGTSGVYESGEALADADWYQLEIDDFTELTFTVEAEFPVRALIVNGNNGCGDADTLGGAVGRECQPAIATAFVGPGTYWLVVLPNGFTDLAQCGARYVATVTRPATCPGDVDGDDDVDLSDLAILLSNFGLTQATRGQGDLDGDGDVDLSDLAGLLANFGGGC